MNICDRKINFVSVSKIYLLEFGIVLEVLYFVNFILFEVLFVIILLFKAKVRIKKSLKIWKGQFEAVKQTIPWPKGQTMIYKTLHRKLKISRRCELGCLARVSMFCTTIGIRILTLVTKQMTSHERGRNDGIVTTTNGTYMWSSFTLIFRNAKLNHNEDRKTFEIMTST